MKRFEGTRSYVATDDLKVAVNAAVALRRPLLVKGEPGTGKTVLAHEIAQATGAELIESSRLPRRSRACTNTTRSPACATASSATRASTTSPTTSAAVNYGRRSRVPPRPCC